jgi:hypothetical protein
VIDHCKGSQDQDRSSHETFHSYLSWPLRYRYRLWAFRIARRPSDLPLYSLSIISPRKANVFCIIGGLCGGTLAWESTDGGAHFTTLTATQQRLHRTTSPNLHKPVQRIRSFASQRRHRHGSRPSKEQQRLLQHLRSQSIKHANF